jgi:hypothetical protein
VKTGTVIGDLCDALKAGFHIDFASTGFSVREYTEVNKAVSRLGSGKKFKINHRQHII